MYWQESNSKMESKNQPPDFVNPQHLTISQELADGEVADWSGGFDCVLGNPPWERIKLAEKEWFAQRNPKIADAPNAAARKRMIEALRERDFPLHAAFLADARKAEGESILVRNTGRYPLCGRGDVNTYSIFAELNRSLLSSAGRVGCIVPTGIATDATTQYFFRDLIERQSLVGLYDFENRQGIFPGIDSRMKFCLLTLAGPDRPQQRPDFIFFALDVEDLADPERRLALTADDIELIHPNTRTCPTFRSKKDAELAKAIYRRVPVLVREARDGQAEENPWGVNFLRMFDMSNDSSLFRTREQLEAEGWELHGNIFERNGERFLPLYEAKLFHQFDHRFATYDGSASGDESTRDMTIAEKADASTVIMPRYWVAEKNVAERLDKTEISIQSRQTDRLHSAGSKTSWLDVGVQEDHQRDQRKDALVLAGTGTGGRRLRLRDATIHCWALAMRNLSVATNERTVIFTLVPHKSLGNSGSIAAIFRSTSDG